MKLDLNTINYINAFEKLTHANVKDCIVENNLLIFIVSQDTVRKAIGERGANVMKAKNVLKKDIRVYAYDDDVTKFIANLLYPVKIDDIKTENKIVNIAAKEPSVKGKIFGRNRENLKRILFIVKRYFDVEEIRVC